MSVFIIAEAGVNHNGDMGLAKRLIDIAVDAGVDAVKFQTWKTDLIVTKSAKQANYQKRSTGIEESQYDMLKKLELSYDDFRGLKRYCTERLILFMSTADEEKSADFLCELQDVFKIGSGELTNLPYLRHIGKLKKRVILSTGMAMMQEVEAALSVLVESGTVKGDITVLHATTEYPAPIDEVNLRAMQTMKSVLGVDVGYSDHTEGIEVPIAAVAMGASVIEKHFTLDKGMDGPDHRASLSPSELRAMVKAIRNVESAMGNGVKTPGKSELANIEIVRKSLVSSVAIQKGDTFTVDNLTVKRPGTGVSPFEWDMVIGTRALRDYAEDELI